MEMPSERHEVAQRPGSLQTLKEGKLPGFRATVIVLLILLGLLLRIVRLPFQPLWWDEGYSVWFATHSLAQIAALTAQDIHPPFYYALLHGWAALLGTGPAALRLLSVIVGVVTIPLLYLVARRMLSARAALLATLLLTISPLHIYYSQEVRMYGLVALLSVGILAAAWRVFQQKSRGEEAAEERRSRAAGSPSRLLTSSPPHPYSPTPLHPPHYRRTLHPVLRHLPARRPDDLCDLVLAA